MDAATWARRRFGPTSPCGLAGGLLTPWPHWETLIMQMKNRDEVLAALAAPFPAAAIKWKPTNVNGNRAMALAFIDARLVMDRLDEVLGCGNWSATYREATGGVICSLSARIEGEWVTHEDFGGLSAQPDAGDKHKAAFSAALKRAAVHLGIGRYLYRLPRQWADYDPQKRQFRATPPLPAWAIPTPDKSAEKPAQKPQQQPAQPAQQKPAEQRKPRQQAQKLERPPEDDQDPAELLGELQVAYLRQELAASQQPWAKEAKVFERFQINGLGDLSLADYRLILDNLSRKGAA